MRSRRNRPRRVEGLDPVWDDWPVFGPRWPAGPQTTLERRCDATLDRALRACPVIATEDCPGAPLGRIEGLDPKAPWLDVLRPPPERKMRTIRQGGVWRNAPRARHAGAR
jgi:hypothetical protein